MTDWHPVEDFDPSWGYTFKWGYSQQHDKTHAWRIPTSEGDGAVTHRMEFEQNFGHPAKTLRGDQIGRATFVPATHKEDGTLVAPPEITLHTSYGLEPHDRVYEWFLNKFPDVVVRKAHLGQHTSGNQIRWAWSEDGGVELNADHDDNPLRYQGTATVHPDSIQVESNRPTPPFGLQAVRAELRKRFGQDVVLPKDKGSFGTDPQIHERDIHLRQMAAVEWADENLHIEDEPVVDLTPEQIDKGRSILRSLFGGKQAANGADMEGAMIAVFIPKDVASKIKVRGGEDVENMHVTLAYFTDKAADRDDWDEVKKICETIANQTAPLSGKIGGVGLFQNDDGDVLWASPSVPGLAELRQKVVEACEDAGFTVSDEHGWVPHITLKYKHRGKLPKLDSDLGLDISELSFAQGEIKDHFKLDGEFVKETSWEMSEWKWPGTHRFVTDGKEILTEPEDRGEWQPSSLEGLHAKFQHFYPDSKKTPASGWAIPTADNMGYGIWAPRVGYGGNEEIGLHELVNKLDKALKKPTHLVEDWGHITDPKMYASTHPD